MGWRRAGRSEDRDLADAAILVEHAIGVTHFLKRGIHQLDLARVVPIGNELERRLDQLRDELAFEGGRIAAPGLDQLLNRRQRGPLNVMTWNHQRRFYAEMSSSERFA